MTWNRFAAQSLLLLICFPSWKTKSRRGPRNSTEDFVSLVIVRPLTDLEFEPIPTIPMYQQLTVSNQIPCLPSFLRSCFRPKEHVALHAIQYWRSPLCLTTNLSSVPLLQNMLRVAEDFNSSAVELKSRTNINRISSTSLWFTTVFDFSPAVEERSPAETPKSPQRNPLHCASAAT